ncbi:MAG: hypothetical protein K6A28_02310 [Bacteroidales bacterium]|nr:hypothetical protein [Bacteroidales bacterium]
MNDLQEPVKRPLGMTIFLVLSLINAVFQIFSSLFTYLFMPAMKELLETGQLEEQLEVFMPTIDEEMADAVMNNITTQLSVQPVYYLLLGLLFIGSLVGVLKMFKLQRLGFHIYSISQMLILIVQVAFLYSKQAHNPFFNEFLTTLMFILFYHLCFKRIEFMENANGSNNNTDQPQ